MSLIAAVVLTAAAPATAEVTTARTSYAPVVRITCPGNIHSSAVVIAPNRVIGAEHGFAAGGCGTEPIWYDRDLDLYVGGTSEAFTTQAAVSCDGVIAGRTYRLIGFEREFSGAALAGYRTIESETGTKDNMMAVEGGAQIGMSGGAVLDDKGALVGIISATNGEVTYVREFSTTSLCMA
ncbi:MAG: hypothetical protein ACK4JY_03885 [Brevundimonas sp.]|uniref:hypothetical protein n=1 Tax=Brevundimonas sp. TaxID=1871086 RepID=UPI003918BFF6